MLKKLHDGPPVVTSLARALSGSPLQPPNVAESDVRIETLRVLMRDGTQLATDTYRPRLSKSPTIVMRTPYGRASDKLVATFMVFARRGYTVVSQDCRGTGESEPDHWDYYMYEAEDSLDCIDWIARQPWYDGFVGSCGGSYAGQTQWCMGIHEDMSAIAPEMSGLGIAPNPANLHMFVNAYARSVGRGANKLPIPHSELERHMVVETLASGFYNAPLDPPYPDSLLARYPALEKLNRPAGRRLLWDRYCALNASQRTALVRHLARAEAVTIEDIENLSNVFGHQLPHDAFALPFRAHAEAARALNAPALLVTGWYDWGLHDALATWQVIQESAKPPIREGSRLIISPSAHNVAGYREGGVERPFRTEHLPGLLMNWYEACRTNSLDDWPLVHYYLMGANEWRTSSQWPPREFPSVSIFLGSGQSLMLEPADVSGCDGYRYDPLDPTPTVGGSIVSHVIQPGSVDVSAVQSRADVLVFSTPPLLADLDVVGTLKALLHVRSSATDTDFVVRLSDVFPDGRAVQLQNGLCRARFRGDVPSLLDPDQIHLLEIDMWATANRFGRGHRIRVDISSSDFPRFDRNTNLGGAEGSPSTAAQQVLYGRSFPSRVEMSVRGGPRAIAAALTAAI